MFSKSILIPVFLLLQYNALFSQAPGYLGKRLFVSANASAIPTLQGPTAGNGGLGDTYNNVSDSYAFSTRFGIEAGYALSRKNAVTFTIDYAKTGLIARLKTPPLSSFGNTNNEDSHYLFYNLNCYTFDLGYQGYKLDRGAIAPMGRYFSFHLFATTASGVIIEKQTTFYNSSFLNQKHADLGVNNTYLMGGFGLEWGKNTIIGNHFFINTTLRFNLTTGVFKTNSVQNGTFLGTYQQENQERFDVAAAERLFYHSLFMVKFGIGILQ
jgi:hypothetical protein